MTAAAFIAVIAILKFVLWLVSRRADDQSNVDEAIAYEPPRARTEHPTGNLPTEEHGAAAGARMAYGDIRDLIDCDSSSPDHFSVSNESVADL